MNPEDEKVLQALDFSFDAEREEKDVFQGVESMRDKKELLLTIFYEHLGALADFIPTGDYPGALDILKRLVETDTRLPEIALNTPIQASGRGSLMLPGEEEILFFGNGEKVRGLYGGVGVGSYYDAECLEQFDSISDYRLYGVYFFLRDATYIDEYCREERYDSPIAILPLNHNSLEIHRIISPRNF